MTDPSTAAGPATPGPDPDATACTVYHDGSCPLCRAEIALYQRLTPDRPVRFVDVSVTPPDGSISDDLTSRDAMARFHVRDGDGRLTSGAEAFGLLWRQYPRFRWLGRLVDLPLVRELAEGVYRLFLVTVRPLLQRFMRSRASGQGREAA